MKPLRMLCAAGMALSPTISLHAQDSLIGTYTGSYAYKGGIAGPGTYGVELNIVSEQDGVVQATVTRVRQRRNRGSCSGVAPMAGKYRDGKLVLRVTEKFGSAADCSFSMVVEKQGDKLVGTTGTRGTGYPIELSKQQ